LKTPAKIPPIEMFLDRHLPIGRQLRARLKDLILSGGLRHGTRLPSTRMLARRLFVSRNTVTFAYEELASEGLVRSKTGSGTHVAAGVRRLRFRDPDGLTVRCVGIGQTTARQDVD
jgi:DNA-binding transcriptional regulator YhcF (GntR family)